jgi:hypothetical protein
LLHFVTSFGLRISLGFSDDEYVGERAVFWEIGRLALLVLWFPAWWIDDTFRINMWAVLIGNSLFWGAALFTLFIAALCLAGVGPVKCTSQFSMRSLLMEFKSAAILLGVLGIAVQNLR